MREYGELILKKVQVVRSGQDKKEIGSHENKIDRGLFGKRYQTIIDVG